MTPVIARQIHCAWTSLFPSKFHNGEVTVADGYPELWLHGSRILWLQQDGLYGSLCGWPTRTTRARINGFCTLSHIDFVVWQQDERQWIEAGYDLPDLPKGTRREVEPLEVFLIQER
jgi:hypothetical protein